MANWTFTRSLMWETGLDEEMCEKILQLVSESSYFFTLDEWRAQLAINEAEIATAENTIAELNEQIADMRESVQKIITLAKDIS